MPQDDEPVWGSLFADRTKKVPMGIPISEKITRLPHAGVLDQRLLMA
jgi:hypothetical protein